MFVNVVCFHLFISVIVIVTDLKGVPGGSRAITEYSVQGDWMRIPFFVPETKSLNFQIPRGAQSHPLITEKLERI